MSWSYEHGYFNPWDEEQGLTHIGTVDYSESYDWSQFDVFQAADGTLVWNQDSGCSCNSPYDDVHSIADMSSGSAAECLKALEDYGRWNDTDEQYTRLHDKLRAL